MVRSVQIAKDNVLKIEVPDSYIGKRIEVIAFAIEEALVKIASPKANKLKKFAAAKIDTQGFKFNRDEANER